MWAAESDHYGSLTECVSPSSRDAHHIVSDVVARHTDRLDTACVLNVLGKAEQRHVVVGDAAVVALVYNDLNHVDNLLSSLLRSAIVFAQHHTEIRSFVRRLAAL